MGVEPAARQPARPRAVLQRPAVASLVDQALSSVTNLTVSVVVARSSDAAGFGSFAVAQAVYAVGVGVVRAGVAESLLSAGRVRVVGRADLVASYAAGAAAAVVMGAVAVGAAATALDGDVARFVGLLGVALPGLVVHDLGRYEGFALRRLRLSLRLDVLWLAGSVAAMVGWAAVGDPSAAALYACWAFSGSAVGLALLARRLAGARRLRSAVRRWASTERQVGGYLLVDFATAQAAAHVLTWFVGIVAGLSAVGAVRAAQLVLGTVAIVFAGWRSISVVEMAAAGEAAAATVRRRGLVLVGLAMAMTVVAVGIPSDLGELVLGDSWRAGRDVMVPVGIGYGVGCTALLPMSRVYASRATSLVLRRQLALLPVQVAVTLGLAAAFGAQGYAWAFAATSAATSAAWWFVARRVRRAPGAGASSAT